MKPKTSRTKKTAINTMFSIAGRVLHILLSFILRTAFIKILGDQYTGVATVFTTILTTLSLSELGFSTAVATALYRPLKEQNILFIQQLMDFYRKAYRLIASFILIVGVSLIPFLQYIIKDVPNVKEDITLIYLLYIIKTCASYLMIYKTTLLRADQKLHIIKKLEMICLTMRYAIEILALFIFKEYMVYLILEVGATILNNFIVTKRAEREYPLAFKTPKIKLSRNDVIMLLKNVKALSLYKISGNIGKSIDTILISSFINTSTVAVVGNYTHMRRSLQTVLMQFYSAVTPSVGNLVAENNSSKQLLVFERLLYLSFLIVNFFSVCLFVLSKPFIAIWLGGSYVLGDNIAFVLAFDFFIYILLQAISSFRTANGLFLQAQYRPLFTALFTVVFALILMKPYGVFGIILATALAKLTTQWYDAYLLYKLIFKESLKKYYLKYWYYIVLFFTSAFITEFVASKIAVNNLFLNFILSGIVCMIIPSLWSIIWTFRMKEFCYVKNLVKDFINNRKKRGAL